MQDAETLERAENPRAVIGGNNPPPYDPERLAECQKKVTDFTDAAGAWLDLKKIDTADQAETRAGSSFARMAICFTRRCRMNGLTGFSR